jgi:hypothetical protein
MTTNAHANIARAAARHIRTGESHEYITKALYELQDRIFAADSITNTFTAADLVVTGEVRAALADYVESGRTRGLLDYAMKIDGAGELADDLARKIRVFVS